PYLPGWLVDLSVSFPTTREATWWTYAYPPTALDPNPPKISTTGFETVWQSVTIGELLRQASLPMSRGFADLKVGGGSIRDDWTGASGEPTPTGNVLKSYAMHLMLLASAFDPDTRIGLLMRTVAPTQNNPWCLLVRGAIVGDAPSGGVISWARSIHADVPAVT